MVEIALWPKKILIVFIKGYQWCISPMLGQRCRFYPSCSHYGLEALQKYGALKGVWLTILRLLKCHPFHAGGVDLVP